MYQVWESSVKTAGPSGAQALLAAAATSVGARGVGNWLAGLGLRWVTRRRITVATSAVLMVALAVVALSTRGGVIY